MACDGCAARRERFNKWKAIAYERAKELFKRGDDPAPGVPELGQHSNSSGHEGDAE